MCRRVGRGCAAALLLALSGCSLGSFLLSAPGSGSKPQVVAGSVDQVSANLEATLDRAGIAVTASRQGQDVRLAGTTHSGKKFALVLKREKTAGEERTAIAVEWERGADEKFWLGVVELLLAPPLPPPPDGYSETYPNGPTRATAAGAK